VVVVAGMKREKQVVDGNVVLGIDKLQFALQLRKQIGGLFSTSTFGKFCFGLDFFFFFFLVFGFFSLLCLGVSSTPFRFQVGMRFGIVLVFCIV
jgi:hypothetical protein